MRPASRSYRDAERDALAPLLDVALALDPEQLPAFLADIRCDAPTVAARLVDLLARNAHPSPEPGAHAAAPSPQMLPTLAPRATLATTAVGSSAARAVAA